MPRVKPLGTMTEANERLREEIRHRSKLQGMGIPNLAKRIGMPESTMYNKLRNPNTFTRGDFMKMAAVFKLSEEERGIFL